jgi:16S rRNA (guanine527-N7)-methyltransferase
MVARHLLDSLSVLPFVTGPRVLDVGSGPGLPGIPLAVAQPEWELVLLDSNGKKTRFMTHAAGRLGLDNVRIVRARVEDYADDMGFDTVISRAFSSLADFVRRAGQLCSESGCLLAMKGRLYEREIASLPAGWQISETRRLSVPGVTASRHLVIIARDGR